MKTTLTLLAALLLAPRAGAITVESTAGNLLSLLSDNQVVTLTVTGSVNAADLDFIANSLTALRSLDLSGATVVPYAGQRLASGRTSSPAATLPEYSLAGLAATELTLPASLRVIAPAALAGSAITSIVIPAGVDSIGAAAFNGCHSLASVTLPEGLRVIEPLTFKGCDALEAITLPATVTAIDSCAFVSCPALATVTWPRSLVTIGSGAFKGSAITSLDLSTLGSLRSLGSYAFAHCEALTNAVLPEGATTLGDGLFFDCTSLASVILPEGIESIAPYLLKGTALTSVDGVLNPDVKRIGRYALHGTSGVVELTLPAGLTAIDDHAMASMTSLSEVDASALPEPPALGEDVFLNTDAPQVTLYATDDTAPLFQAAPQWQEFDIQVKQNTEVGSVTSPDLEHMGICSDGNTLSVSATRDIALVELFDVNGRLRARVAPGAAATEATVDVSALDHAAIYILRVTFAGDTTATARIKL